ncbi:hypothetical protein O3M35_005525 [Rhynocoris fuscipes]|uniref:HCLS1-associated protein X-1 n=1 Tax=Rhynocoris fuscipes TaxID=488301 RepID=A0AAW1DKP2_9HEMI
MSFFDYFRRALLPPNHPGHPGFRNPIWEEDTDEDDELDDEFRHSPSSPFGFQIFTGDVMEMHKYFEQQMDEMLKSFHSSLFGTDLLELPDSSFVEPFHEHKKETGASKYLKPGYDFNVQDSIAKKDTDLDGRITSGDLKKLFPNDEETISHVPSKVFGQSVITRIIRTSDGKLEEEKRVRGSDGREEVSITRQIGDQKYKVITKKDSQTGVTDTTEELINLDEDKLAEFNKKWGGSSNAITEPPQEPDSLPVRIYPPDNGNRITKLFEKWFK